MDGCFYHFTPAFLIGSDVDVQQGPFAPWALPHFIATTDLAVTVSPSADFPVDAGYTANLAPPISRWGEDGFSSCSTRPCHRAVPNHPAGVSRRISQIAPRHAAFAANKKARPPGLSISRPPRVHSRYGPVTYSPS
jgi:hypothetical protein